jgi:hypothetical protein
MPVGPQVDDVHEVRITQVENPPLSVPKGVCERIRGCFTVDPERDVPIEED